MAKARTKKKVEAEVAPVAVSYEPKSAEPLEPQKIHELFGISGPYEPPPRPIGLKGFVTFWDPGTSINSLAKKHRGSSI